MGDGTDPQQVNCDTGSNDGGTVPEKQVEECQDSGLFGGAVTCGIARVIIAIFGGFISLMVSIMLMMDSFFNVALKYTILDFNTWFTILNDPITRMWTIFRDLGNILIIGFFTFIAISIILGLQEYGQKKLIARVMIIATLINFSFLFTIIVINTSNLLATTVYNAIPPDPDAAGTAVGTQQTDKSIQGIGDRLIKYMGVQSALDTRNTLMKQYNSGGTNAPFTAKTGDYSNIFLHGFVVFVFFLTASLAFLYGALLLLSRFVILIIVLMVSAAAFAFYLSPSLEESTWGRWWHALLRNSFLAPILMLFLYGTIIAAQALVANRTIGPDSSLGNFVSDPRSAGAWSFAFSMFFILGMLVAGFYIASKMATGAASRLALNAAGLGAGISSRLVGGAARWYLGGKAAQRSHEHQGTMDRLTAKINNPDTSDEERAKARAQWRAAYRAKGRSDFLAKSSFEMANTKPVQKLLAAGGLGGVFGKKDDSYEKSTHAKVDAAMKEAMKAAITDTQGTKQARKQYEDDKGMTEQDRAHEDSKRILKAVEEGAAAQKNAENLLSRMTEQRSEVKDALEKKAESAQKLARREISEDEHRENMRGQDARIEAANRQIGGIQNRIREIDNTSGLAEAQRVHAQTRKEKEAFDASLKDKGREWAAQSRRNAEERGASLYGNLLERSVYASTGKHLDEHGAHEVAEKVRKKSDSDRLGRAQRNKEKSDDTEKDTGHSAGGGGGAATGGAAGAATHH